jgi:hypothetical protein
MKKVYKSICKITIATPPGFSVIELNNDIRLDEIIIDEHNKGYCYCTNISNGNKFISIPLNIFNIIFEYDRTVS